jgi:hypothetical protein
MIRIDDGLSPRRMKKKVSESSVKCFPLNESLKTRTHLMQKRYDPVEEALPSLQYFNQFALLRDLMGMPKETDFSFVDSVPATKETISRSHDLARGNARGSKTSASKLQGDCLHPSAYILLQHCGLGREQGEKYFRIAQRRPPNRLRIQSGRTGIGRDG